MNTATTELVISLEDDAKNLGLDEESLKQLLAAQDVSGEVKSGPLPVIDGAPVEKDAALIILASGVSLAAVLVALKSFLRPYFWNNMLRGEVETLEPVLNPDGTVKSHEDGSPVYQVVNTRPLSLEEKTEVEAELFGIFKLKVHSSSR